jgi:hypothetical protein
LPFCATGFIDIDFLAPCPFQSVELQIGVLIIGRDTRIAFSSDNFRTDLPDTQAFDFMGAKICPKNPDFPDSVENSIKTRVSGNMIQQKISREYRQQKGRSCGLFSSNSKTVVEFYLPFHLVIGVAIFVATGRQIFIAQFINDHIEWRTSDVSDEMSVLDFVFRFRIEH